MKRIMSLLLILAQSLPYTVLASGYRDRGYDSFRRGEDGGRDRRDSRPVYTSDARHDQRTERDEYRERSPRRDRERQDSRERFTRDNKGHYDRDYDDPRDRRERPSFHRLTGPEKRQTQASRITAAASGADTYTTAPETFTSSVFRTSGYNPHVHLTASPIFAQDSERLKKEDRFIQNHRLNLDSQNWTARTAEDLIKLARDYRHQRGDQYKLSKAAEIFQHVARQEQYSTFNRSEALRDLAKMSMRLQNNRAAEEYLRESLKLDNTNAATYMTLGDFLITYPERRNEREKTTKGQHDMQRLKERR